MAVLDAPNYLVRLLLAPACPACACLLDRPLSHMICDSCWGAIPRLGARLCARCGDELARARVLDDLCGRCRRRPPPYSVARSAGRYDGSLRELVHAFKFQKRRLLAEPLGSLMRDAGDAVLDDADAVVPVPLHPFRSFTRGFNQADDLARQTRLPVWRVLRRVRHGPPQASLSAAGRHGHLRGAYRLALRARWRHVGGLPIQGTTLVLIDDLMTTGETMEECARVLMEGGAKEVRALTVARAVTGRPLRRPA
jgi:ComF family protein